MRAKRLRASSPFFSHTPIAFSRSFEIAVDYVSLCFEARQGIPVFECWRAVTPVQLLTWVFWMLFALLLSVTFMAAVPNALLPSW